MSHLSFEFNRREMFQNVSGFPSVGEADSTKVQRTLAVISVTEVSRHWTFENVDWSVFGSFIHVI
jgi:hypothetical protein